MIEGEGREEIKCKSNDTQSGTNSNKQGGNRNIHKLGMDDGMDSFH
jgi:hypothetical protein